MKTVHFSNLTRQTSIADRVQVADNSLTRMIGLLGHFALEADAGLWIVPCNSIHSFGMRFLFDAIFLDRDLKVVHLVSTMKPWRVSALIWSAKSVLELPGGAIKRTGTLVGDQLKVDSPKD